MSCEKPPPFERGDSARDWLRVQNEAKSPGVGPDTRAVRETVQRHLEERALRRARIFGGTLRTRMQGALMVVGLAGVTRRCDTTAALMRGRVDEGVFRCAGGTARYFGRSQLRD